MPLKRMEPKHGQFEDLVPDKMPVRYEMRRHLAGVGASVVPERNSMLLSALRVVNMESSSCMLVSLFALRSSTESTVQTSSPQLRI